MTDWLPDVLLVMIYVALVLAVLVTVVSALLSAKRQAARVDSRFGMTSGRVALLTAAAIVVCLVVTYAIGSDKPISVGGESYTAARWLKIADMFIHTVTVEIVAAVAIALLLPFIVRVGKRKSHHVQKK